MTGAWDLVKRWSFEERLELTDAAHKVGLEARAGRISMRELALEALMIATVGLERQRALNQRGDNESIYLMRLLDQVRNGWTQASLTIERWKGRWNYDVQRMVEGTAYEAERLS
jgi:glutamate--cysteine ligase